MSTPRNPLWWRGNYDGMLQELLLGVHNVMPALITVVSAKPRSGMLPWVKVSYDKTRRVSGACPPEKEDKCKFF